MECENENSKWLLRTENMTQLSTAHYKNICYSLQQNTSWMTDTACPQHFNGTLQTAPPQSADPQVFFET
jgi:hypothetical protein